MIAVCRVPTPETCQFSFLVVCPTMTVSSLHRQHSTTCAALHASPRLGSGRWPTGYAWGGRTTTVAEEPQKKCHLQAPSVSTTRLLFVILWLDSWPCSVL